MQWYYILLIVLFSVLLLYVVAGIVFNKTVYDRRSDYNKYLKYFTVDDFPGLERADYFIQKKNGTQIAAFMYQNSSITSYKGVITFIHGIGAGHEAYTSIIDLLCSNGYIVFSYDMASCGLSQGKGVKSPKQALEDLRETNKWLANTGEYAQYKHYVVGHSLGGFASLCSSSLDLDIKFDKIISISAINKSLGDVTPLKGLCLFFSPLLRLVEVIYYKKYLGISGANSVLSANTPTLIIHGNKDNVVSIEVFRKLQKAAISRDNVTCVELNNRHHQPHVSIKAEEIIDSKVMKLATLSIVAKRKTELLKELSDSIDFNQTIEPNKELFEDIFSFLEN